MLNNIWLFDAEMPEPCQCFSSESYLLMLSSSTCTHLRCNEEVGVPRKKTALVDLQQSRICITFIALWCRLDRALFGEVRYSSALNLCCLRRRFSLTDCPPLIDEIGGCGHSETVASAAADDDYLRADMNAGIW